MRCSYVVQPHNKRCRRQAEPDRQWCTFHEEHEAERLANFYGPGSRSFEEGLALAAKVEDVDLEIALLRVAIRDAFQVGQMEPTRRAIETLSRLLVSQKRWEKRGQEEGFPPELLRILDEMEEEEEDEDREPKKLPSPSPTPN